MLLWAALRTGHRSLRDANVFLFLHVPVATVAVSPRCSNGNSHARLLEQFAPSTIKATFHSIPDQLLTFNDPNGMVPLQHLLVSLIMLCITKAGC